MTINRTTVSGHVPTISFDSGKGIGEGFTIHLSNKVKLVVVNRYVFPTFWMIKVPEGSPFSYIIMDSFTTWRTMAKGWLSDTTSMSVAGYTVQIKDGDIHLIKEPEPLETMREEEKKEEPSEPTAIEIEV